ncbi:MAG: hypothetical protein ACKO0W_06050 [Planctomycetota bacterium]
MRLLHTIVDVLVVGAAAGGLAIGLALYRADLAEQTAIESTRAAVSTMNAQIGMRTLLSETTLNEHGFPTSIDPSWFETGEPRNALARAEAPWVELASEAESNRKHPIVPTFRSGRGAMFWYNPSLGVVRARVPEQTTDESTRTLYTLVNGSGWE